MTISQGKVTKQVPRIHISNKQRLCMTKNEVELRKEISKQKEGNVNMQEQDNPKYNSEY